MKEETDDFHHFVFLNGQILLPTNYGLFFFLSLKPFVFSIFFTRRQTPYYWASQNHSPENSEYVIYLYKRSLRNKQKHGLEEYELVSGGLAPPPE